MRQDRLNDRAQLCTTGIVTPACSGSVSTVIAGLDYCVQNRTVLNVRVINLSMGLYPRESYRTDPLCAAVRRAVQAGIVVVCSAGNRGKDLNGVLRYGGIS